MWTSGTEVLMLAENKGVVERKRLIVRGSLTSPYALTLGSCFQRLCNGCPFISKTILIVISLKCMCCFPNVQGGKSVKIFW